MLWSFYKRSNLRKIRDEGYDSNINTGAMKKKMKNPNIAEITKHYVNKWVALSEDHTKVLASGKTLAEVAKKTASEKRVMVFRVLPGLTYAPSQF